MEKAHKNARKCRKEFGRLKRKMQKTIHHIDITQIESYNLWRDDAHNFDGSTLLGILPRAAVYCSSVSLLDNEPPKR